jgi:hypothetical protein
MTIHWKALEKHFLRVPLVFQFNHFRGKMHVLNFAFSKKKIVLKGWSLLKGRLQPFLVGKRGGQPFLTSVENTEQTYNIYFVGGGELPNKTHIELNSSSHENPRSNR